MSTSQLQMEPVVFHILPDCWTNNNGGNCVAGGLYFNDDGETLDNTDFNKYLFNYTQPE